MRARVVPGEATDAVLAFAGTMCGRFSFTDSRGAPWARERFGAPLPQDVPGGRWNIAPTDPVLTIGVDRTGARCAEMLRWDLFARRPPVINVRSETALERPAFRRLLDRAHGRVLVPADGFYEWLHAEQASQPKLPMRYSLKDGSVFAFAGVRSQTGCAIFTTAANELIAPVHDRMPVIVDDRDEEAAWLDPRLDAASAVTLLDALPASRMRAKRASSRVNDVRNDGPKLWQPDATPATATLF